MTKPQDKDAVIEAMTQAVYEWAENHDAMLDFADCKGIAKAAIEAMTKPTIKTDNTQVIINMQGQIDDLRSIFRRCADIIGFHNGDDSEKVEAIRKTLLQAPHLEGYQAHKGVPPVRSE